MKIQLLAISLLILSQFSFAQTGTWTQLTNNAPNYNYGVMLLLTDGTVLCHNRTGGTYGKGWNLLKPDANGSYINGTWTTLDTMANDRLYFSSQVLPNGQVYVAGGEYGAGGTAGGEIYNPVTNKWSLCGPIPSGWNVYDGNSELLYNGNVLEGPQVGGHPSYDCLFYTPGTNLFTSAPSSIYNHDEAQWLKLPDSSILFVGIASTNTNRYIPQTNTWVTDASAPVQLYDQYGSEAGAGFMLPNGKAIFFGATPHNAIYTPSGNSNPGSWTAAADFPTIGTTSVGMVDAAAAMMVNGHILCAVSPIGTSNTDEFRHPVYFVEYNYLTNSFTQVTGVIPGFGADSIAGRPCYTTNMLDLPDGNVLLGLQGYSEYFVYTPGSAAIAAGKPTINSILPDACPSYKITGKLFNGISEGAAYGDDWQMSSNYPLVRLSNGSTVYYTKTTNWNRIGTIRTDSLEDTAIFTLPASLPAGTYSLVVVVNGFASNPVIFNTYQVAASVIANVSCKGGNNGSASATLSGGFSPFTYVWSSGATTSAATNLSAGTYTVHVSDKNGCSGTAQVTISQPATVLVASISSQTASCNGGNNGSATAGATGGITPYSYSWSPGGATTQTASGLSAGTYTLTAKDFHGCTSTASVLIVQSPMIRDSMISADIANIKCNGESDGATKAGVKGGNSPYTYSWAPVNGTTTTLSSISAGSYTVYITDKNGCTSSSSITLTQPSSIRDSLVSLTGISCFGNDNGKATIGVKGGTTPFTYTWTTGVSTTASATSLKAQSYTVTIKDKNGCSQTVSFTETQPSAIRDSIIAVSKVNVSCNGGSNAGATIGVKSGTSPYTYLWSPGGITKATASGLTAGIYSITITDKNGCTETTTCSITQPSAALAISILTQTNVACLGNATASITAKAATGGTGPYTYTWKPSGGNGLTASDLSAGTYTITATDSHGCTATVSATIAQPSSALNILKTSHPDLGPCNGSAKVTVSGGVSPYSYSWSPGGQTKDSAHGLCFGNYCCTVTDHNHCTDSVCVIISLESGINDIDYSSTITLYPNPGTGQFTLSGLDKGMIIEIYDYTGRKIETQIIESLQSQLTINLQSKANGIYLVRILSKDGALLSGKKVVKTE